MSLASLSRPQRFVAVALMQAEAHYRPNLTLILGSPGYVKDRPFRLSSLLFAGALFGLLIAVGKGWV